MTDDEHIRGLIAKMRDSMRELRDNESVGIKAHPNSIWARMSEPQRVEFLQLLEVQSRPD